MRTIKTILLSAGSSFLLASVAQALPELQLYIEGATYDAGSETWVASSSGTLRLWAIGNVSGPGAHGAISDVHLSIAYAGTATPTISITPTTAGGVGTYNGFTDPSTPGAATFIQTVINGSSPVMSDGDSLPSHGIFGAGTSWSEYLLGTFATADSPSGDFISSFPSPGGANEMQINVYDITITGADTVHFDLYNSIMAGNHVKATFAPFSHDAEGGNDNPPPGNVPDASTTVLLLGVAMLGLEVMRRRFARA